jgi:hypothetical protein
VSSRLCLIAALASAGILVESPLAASAELDPTGIWACVTYGDERARDLRFLVHITATGTGSLALQTSRSAGQWTAIFPLSLDEHELAFTDSETGRRFTADLTRRTLAGTWSTPVDSGGWWCARRVGAAEAAALAMHGSAAEHFVPLLIPEVSASPRYPRQAVREAKEGYAVACFFVDSSGTILEAEVVELSNEFFRAPTLAATYSSQYRPWTRDTGLRPGCRTYSFQLDKTY